MQTHLFMSVMRKELDKEEVEGTLVCSDDILKISKNKSVSEMKEKRKEG